MGLRFANAGDKERLIDIKQWGKAQVGQHVEGGYFHGCVNMVVTATDPLDLTGTVSLTSMFRNTAIDSRGNLSLWNTQVSYLITSLESHWSFGVIVAIIIINYNYCVISSLFLWNFFTVCFFYSNTFLLLFSLFFYQ